LPVAEESHLLEAEISLAPFGIDNSDEVDVETENTTEESECGDLGRSKSAFSEKEREFNNSEESETVEPILEKRDAEPIDTSPSQVSIIVCIRITETSKFFSFLLNSSLF
jgi:hypothetical protein